MIWGFVHYTIIIFGRIGNADRPKRAAYARERIAGATYMYDISSKETFHGTSLQVFIVHCQFNFGQYAVDFGVQ